MRRSIYNIFFTRAIVVTLFFLPHCFNVFTFVILYVLYTICFIYVKTLKQCEKKNKKLYFTYMTLKLVFLKIQL